MGKVIFRTCRLQSRKKIIASRKSGGITNHENAKPESSEPTGAWDLFHKSSQRLIRLLVFGVFPSL